MMTLLLSSRSWLAILDPALVSGNHPVWVIPASWVQADPSTAMSFPVDGGEVRLSGMRPRGVRTSRGRSRGCSGDVLDVVGDVDRAAGAEDLVEAFEELRLLGRGSLLNGSLGKLVRSHVLEVDPAAGHPGDGRVLLARGQGLRSGEQVPLCLRGRRR
jgi:hypothetical protein